jgi:molecular chaperone DnaK
MSTPKTTVYGIDLGTTYSCIARVDEYLKPEVISNEEGDRITPSVVLFEAGDNIVVGRTAKESAVLTPGRVVEMVKRHMGEKGWTFDCDGKEYPAEEISSYILRKLARDAQEKTGEPVHDVVITCPAYFGIAEREATANAGRIAGLHVREVINEPTAAAIVYGVQNEQDQVVMVYDLGGGTFDVTVIEIKGGAITVIVTGGDHNLGGKDWDEIIVQYLSQQWMEKTGSFTEPANNEETLQDLWLRAENAKRALSSKQEVNVPVTHDGQREGITLTREKFNDLTAHLLESTMKFTTSTIEAAARRGYTTIDQILLVGGSTRMPQVQERLKALNIPLKVHDPDESVAKGAAIYAQKLMLNDKIEHKVAAALGMSTEQVDFSQVSLRVLAQAQEAVASDEGLMPAALKKVAEVKVTNVASHSFGVVVKDEEKDQDIISNLVLIQNALPTEHTREYYTIFANQSAVRFTVMENIFDTEEVDDPGYGEEIGVVTLPMPPGMPKHSPVEVTFELNNQGRLHIMAREPSSQKTITAEIQVERGLSEIQVEQAVARAQRKKVS